MRVRVSAPHRRIASSSSSVLGREVVGRRSSRATPLIRRQEPASPYPFHLFTVSGNLLTPVTGRRPPWGRTKPSSHVGTRS